VQHEHQLNTDTQLSNSNQKKRQCISISIKWQSTQRVQLTI